jgi:hypothetical protein
MVQHCVQQAYGGWLACMGMLAVRPASSVTCCHARSHYMILMLPIINT